MIKIQLFTRTPYQNYWNMNEQQKALLKVEQRVEEAFKFDMYPLSSCISGDRKFEDPNLDHQNRKAHIPAQMFERTPKLKAEARTEIEKLNQIAQKHPESGELQYCIGLLEHQYLNLLKDPIEKFIKAAHLGIRRAPMKILTLLEENQVPGYKEITVNILKHLSKNKVNYPEPFLLLGNLYSESKDIANALNSYLQAAKMVYKKSPKISYTTDWQALIKIWDLYKNNPNAIKPSQLVRAFSEVSTLKPDWQPIKNFLKHARKEQAQNLT